MDDRDYFTAAEGIFAAKLSERQKTKKKRKKVPFSFPPFRRACRNKIYFKKRGTYDWISTTTSSIDEAAAIDLFVGL